MGKEAMSDVTTIHCHDLDDIDLRPLQSAEDFDQ